MLRISSFRNVLPHSNGFFCKAPRGPRELLVHGVHQIRPLARLVNYTFGVSHGELCFVIPPPLLLCWHWGEAKKKKRERRLIRIQNSEGSCPFCGSAHPLLISQCEGRKQPELTLRSGCRAPTKVTFKTRRKGVGEKKGKWWNPPTQGRQSIRKRQEDVI